MALKKGTLQPLVDAAVGAAVTAADPIYGGLEKVRRARNLTQGQRRKAEKDAARNRAMFDIPEGLEQVLDKIAERVSVPRSQVAAFLMLRGLEYAQLEEFIEAREPSRSMRYEFNLSSLPEIPEQWR